MKWIFGLIVLLGACVASWAELGRHPNQAVVPEVIVPVYSTQEPDNALGTLILRQTRYGVLIIPTLKQLPPGLHGFHLHEKASCEAQGNGAGGHYDPQKTGKHLGPYSRNGHAGDLPVLWVDSRGKATLPLMVVKLSLKQMRGHTFIIHANSDNYSDDPKPLGGGGPRIACAVLK